MNKMKKLGIAVLALAVCVLLSVSAWAATALSVDIDAAAEKSEFCVTGAVQTATVTVKADEEIEVFSFGATVSLPEGWTLISIENEELGITADDYSTENGKLFWYSGSTANKKTTTLAKITVQIPADVTAGEYEVGMTALELTKITLQNNGYDIGYYADDLTVTAKITLRAHNYAVTHTWNADNTSCTVTRTCVYDASHTDTATSTEVIPSVKTPATCEDMGWTTYTAKFAQAWAEDHSKSVKDIPALGHAWGEPTSYTDNGDGTHTAHYTCENDAAHTKSDEAVDHDFTNGDCVCGAEEPAQGLKGDVNGDGFVNSTDLTLLARHVGGIETFNDATVLANADVNEDGLVNSADLTKHARYVGGIITDWSQD